MDSNGLTVKEVKGWVEAKDQIEKEIDELLLALNQDGVGLHGNLVDDEGFPISDVEKILRTRDARHRIACKRSAQWAIEFCPASLSALLISFDPQV